MVQRGTTYAKRVENDSSISRHSNHRCRCDRRNSASLMKYRKCSSRSPHAGSGWFDKAVRASGVPRTTPHDLRHTAASLAVSAGANVKAVQKMLGHASAAMTLDIYADLFDDDLEAVATALDEARARESVGKMWARPHEPTR
jgi:integrase